MRSLTVKQSAAALLAALVSSQASAYGWVADAKVLQVRVDKNGKGMVIFDRPMTGSPPGCVIPYYANAMAFEGVNGRAVMAMALAAKAMGSSLTVYGAGTCSVYGSYVEDWEYGH